MIPKVIFSEGKKDWVKRPLLSNIDKILDYRGRTPKKLGLSWSDTGYLALSALNVKNGYIDFNADANYGDQELYDRWMGDNHLHKGQVVFTTEAPMGNVAQLPNDDLYILSQRTIAFEVKHDLIIEDFLATLLRSPKIFNELTSLSSGGTAKGVSQKSLSNLKVCVPTSLEEQSAIGSFFRTLDDLLASYKNNLANHKSLKATMLSKMFPKAGQTVPEIRLDGFEGEWELLEINDLADDFQSGGTPKTNVQEYWDGDIPWIQSSDLETNCLFEIKVQKSISEKGLKNSSAKIIPKDSIAVVTRVGVGKLAVMRHEYATSQDFLSLSNLKSNIEFTAYLLYRLLQKEVTQLQGTSIKGITKVELLSKKVLIPSFSEQQAIGAYFSNLDNLIAVYQEKISQLETLKKKLLQDMFI
ncbi:MAG: restriction endonuclease subunit S [Streptococcus parasanguinis]|jgi:hsdS subunit